MTPGVAAVMAAYAALRRHSLAGLWACACGFKPQTREDWERHRDAVLMVDHLGPRVSLTRRWGET
jgi:hypothetical protein